MLDKNRDHVGGRISAWRNSLKFVAQTGSSRAQSFDKVECYAQFGDYRVQIPDTHCDTSMPLPLSEREKQVLFLSASGLTSRQIAAEINVLESTVATFRRRILIKLGCRSMPEAVALATACALGARVCLAPELIAH